MAANPYYEGLIESIKVTSVLIQALTKDLKNNEVSQATLKARVDAVDEGLRSLMRLVRDGNGSNSIMTRLALIEEDVEGLGDRDAEFRKYVYAKVEEWEGHNRKVSTNKRLAYNRERVLTVLKILPGVIALVSVLVGWWMK